MLSKFWRLSRTPSNPVRASFAVGKLYKCEGVFLEFRQISPALLDEIPLLCYHILAFTERRVSIPLQQSQERARLTRACGFSLVGAARFSGMRFAYLRRIRRGKPPWKQNQRRGVLSLRRWSVPLWKTAPRGNSLLFCLTR